VGVERYKSLDEHSGVVAFEIGPDFIKVRFRDGPIYVYNSARPGAEHVERMKELARAGRGLSTYISQHVGSLYAFKGPEPAKGAR
jgi:hypothetical protein